VDRARQLLAGVALFLAACGGGGSSGPTSGGPITPAPALRTDLLFGYYSQDAATVLETAGHANLYFAGTLLGPLDQLAGLAHAKAAGYQHVLLVVPSYYFGGGPMPASEIRLWLQRIDSAGLLVNIDAIYPIDEPDTEREGNRSDAEVTAQNAVIRGVMAGFPQLARTRLAVIYSNSGRYPGIASYDWLGVDDYDRRCGVTSQLEALRMRLRPDQRIIVVPGGSDPWRQDPACLEVYAHATPQVVAVTPFIWQTETDGARLLGIRENGMRALYCQAGRKISAGTAEGCG
jgi:hypothetical protein